MMHRSPSRRRKLASLLLATGGALLIVAISAALAFGANNGGGPSPQTYCHDGVTIQSLPNEKPQGATPGSCESGPGNSGTPGPPENENCPEAQGNGCGGGAGNCGSNPGNGSGGQDQGYGNGEGCGSDEGDGEGDDDGDDGGDDGGGDPVDACPDALNPGIQSAGATCVTGGGGTPSAGDTPASGDSGPGAADAAPSDAGGDDIAPGVDVEATSLTLGVQSDGPATIGGEVVVPGESDASGGGAAVAGAAAGGTSAVDTPAGELPYTGGPVTWIAILGALLVALGMAGTVLGARAERRAVAA